MAKVLLQSTAEAGRIFAFALESIAELKFLLFVFWLVFEAIRWLDVYS